MRIQNLPHCICCKRTLTELSDVQLSNSELQVYCRKMICQSQPMADRDSLIPANRRSGRDAHRLFIACDRLNIVVTTLTLALPGRYFVRNNKRKQILLLPFDLYDMYIQTHASSIMYFRYRSVVINASLTISIYNNSDSGPGSGCQCDSGESRSQQGHWSDISSVSHQIKYSGDNGDHPY